MGRPCHVKFGLGLFGLPPVSALGGRQVAAPQRPVLPVLSTQGRQYMGRAPRSFPSCSQAVRLCRARTEQRREAGNESRGLRAEAAGQLRSGIMNMNTIKNVPSRMMSRRAGLGLETDRETFDRNQVRAAEGGGAPGGAGVTRGTEGRSHRESGPVLREGPGALVGRYQWSGGALADTAGPGGEGWTIPRE
ncbi:hypothetical protein NDU88_006333 [Pleurodeles waltl]|uniref:Uncharacterized protein n=1 Tax=Pleurodeles waltl TaxID=8319 RepID=A0AAV7LUL1_PLEWA|nr:hypothetical protein NDU88_006333 [Pleurodeles waltl]